MTKTGRVILAAGGTGGHLFPAQALAQELGRRGHVVDLVSDARARRYGADFPARAVHVVSSATLTALTPTAVWRTASRLTQGVGEARALMAQDPPHVVVGFGGYPSFPPILAAVSRGIPTIIHEQNAVMGRANRFLARLVRHVATAYDKTAHLPKSARKKVRPVGNPVRDNVVAEQGRPYPPLRPDGPFRLVVFGGSQGARFFSDLLPPALARLPQSYKSRLRLVQQCREEDMARTQAALKTAGIVSELSTFFANLPHIIAESHLVIARAGASTVAELAVLGRPALLVPLPHALDNDQLMNARRMAEAGGGWCCEQKDLTPQSLADDIMGLMDRPERLAAAAEAARRLGKPQAVRDLADLVEETMGESAP